jgi:hypothetical protein
MEPTNDMEILRDHKWTLETDICVQELRFVSGNPTGMNQELHLRFPSNIGQETED